MKRIVIVLSILFSLLCNMSALSGQIFAEENQKLSIMWRWWMPYYGDGDHMTTNNKSEQPGSSTFDGQQFYIPATLETGTHDLYRLYNSSWLDHMDSLTTDEGYYQKELTLGYPSNSISTGLCEIRRWYKSSIHDHMTGFCGENASSSGYSDEGVILGYGYPRYGTSCETLIAISGSQVQISANKVAGGTISELWWNGKQFINDYDYGRQIQIAFNLTSTAEEDNPTEGGDGYGCPGTTTGGWAHGSPLLSYSVNGKILNTTTIPLQWNPSLSLYGGGESNPVAWKGTIGKTVELDYAGYPNRIRWNTRVNFPYARNYLDLQTVVAHLNDEFYNGLFYAFNAQDNRADSISMPTNGCIDPSTDSRLRPYAGGVIIATSDGNYALGVYRKTTNNNFGLCRYDGSTTGKYGYKMAALTALERPSSGVPAGELSVTVYLVVGTFTTVQNEMRTMYLQGY